MKLTITTSLLALLTAFYAGGALLGATSGDTPRIPTRSLLIVAHPDDEYELAATVYRIAVELGGAVDQVIISDGEGGFRYSSLAARYYGINLTDEATGRANLPRIREEESRRAARVLGIRHQWFLNEKDDHFTLDVNEALASWNVKRVSDQLTSTLKKGQYDFVFVLLPAEGEHGEHKAATILALQAVQVLSPEDRPVVLAATAEPQEDREYKPVAAFPITSTKTAAPLFHFDRATHFGFRNSLSYEIVVDWVIAAHKSQGLFQTKAGQDRFENFWLFADADAKAVARAESLFRAIGAVPTIASEANHTH